jgi:SOS-response transcriptional repressor LexA|tara:strand:- start:1327 stop:1527 length:201 start_codon:yes stop_codon:yes gene_type:complete
MTPKNKQLLDYIEAYSDANGYPPTYEEMKKHLKLKSKSSIHFKIRLLARDGHIEYTPSLTRSIKVK